MELEQSTVFGSRRSPISDDRWQERDERPNVKSHASASFPPLLSSPLSSPPHLSCSASFHSHKRMQWGSASPVHIHSTQMQFLFFLSSLLTSYFFYPPPSPLSFHLVSNVQYTVHHGGRQQPTLFWLNEHAKSFEPLGLWILLCYFVVFVVMNPWMTAC